MKPIVTLEYVQNDEEQASKMNLSFLIFSPATRIRPPRRLTAGRTGTAAGGGGLKGSTQGRPGRGGGRAAQGEGEEEGAAQGGGEEVGGGG